ncbi:MAG: DUF58 domain-containing protein [Isosphaeraceae bacterium]|nr:DUF58 domain-containing protein [Isosphaeraceae bacterium]
MPGEPRIRPNDPRRGKPSFLRWVAKALWPNERLRWTKEGIYYLFVWFGLLGMGLYQQINLILLTAGLAAGPVVASILVSTSMLRGLQAWRRVPAYVFAGDPLRIDYSLENDRRFTAALALHVSDEVVPVDRTSASGIAVTPDVFFARVPGRGIARVRWEGPAPGRGRYELRSLEIVTRSPFGLLERRLSLDEKDPLLVYPRIGQLTRRWHMTHREATETRRGMRHDRAMQQQEYHGLRDYRPGDSPRWIHWRTSARVGVPMVKEFEQQHEQDLAILVDPWLPRTKVTHEQRESLETAISFAATLCLETCRQSARRLLLGWTGPVPGIRQGPASVKLLHETLEQLAILRPVNEGSLAGLLDALPPVTLREALIVIVSTRSINLNEEAEKTTRLSGGASRGLVGRVTLFDGSRTDLSEFIQFDDARSASTRRGPRLLEDSREAETAAAAPDQEARATPANAHAGSDAEETIA